MSDLRAIDAAIRAVERDADLLRLVRDWRAEFHAELAEIRDGMTALSNRIEAATRAITDLREDVSDALVNRGTLG